MYWFRFLIGSKFEPASLETPIDPIVGYQRNRHVDSVFGSYGSHLVPNNQYGRGLSSNCKSSLLQPFLAPPVYPTYSNQFQPSNGQLVIWFFGFLASPIPTSRPAGAESVCDSGMEPASSAQPPPGKMPKNSVSFGKTPNETSVMCFAGFLQQCSTFQEGFLICALLKKRCMSWNQWSQSLRLSPRIGIRLSPDVHQGHILRLFHVVSIPIVSISQDRAPPNPTVFSMIFHIWHLLDETIQHFTTLRTYFAVWIHGIHGEITWRVPIRGPPQWRRLRRSGIDWFQSPPSDALRSPRYRSRGYPFEHHPMDDPWWHRWALKPMVTTKILKKAPCIHSTHLYTKEQKQVPGRILQAVIIDIIGHILLAILLYPPAIKY